MQNHLEIETHAFYLRSGIEKPELMSVGCSGGHGHNIAIRSIQKYLIAKGIIKAEDLTKFPIQVKKKKKSKKKTDIRLSAYLLSKFPEGFDIPLRFPELPNVQELDDEVERLIKEQEKLGAHKDYIDMLLDVFKGWRGYYAAAVWNIFQRQDKTKQLKKLIPFQYKTDVKNYEYVREYFYKKLNQGIEFGKPYTDLISTQAMALPALCDAVRQYNSENKGKYPEVKIHQYMTDLPTLGAVHFFETLATLTKEQCQQMYLYGVNLKENLPALDKKYGLSQKPFAKLINIDPADNPMVRPGFKNLKGISFTKDTVLKVQAKNVNGESVEEEYVIRPGEKITCIGASDATFDYTKKLLQKRLYTKIFVFGGNNPALREKIEAIYNARYHTISENERKKEKELGYDIVYLGDQDDVHSARIRARAQLKIIRGGGLTIMEEMAIIHALLEELSKNAKSEEEKAEILKNLEQIILLHAKRDNKNEFTSGISWEDCNGDELIKYFKKICSRIKVARTSPFEILDELQHRSPFRKFLDARAIPEKKPAIEDDSDMVLIDLANEINKIRSLSGVVSASFVGKLDALWSVLRADYIDQKQRQVGIKKIRSSASMRIAEETRNLLQDLQAISEEPIDRLRNQYGIARIDTYEKKCNRIVNFSPFMKAVAVVIAAAVGFLLGAVIGGGIGFFLGAWAGPGAVVTTLLGLLKGAYSGAALGLAVGTFFTGISTASLSSYLLFKPNKMTNDIHNIAVAGKEIDFKLGQGR